MDEKIKSRVMAAARRLDVSIAPQFMNDFSEYPSWPRGRWMALPPEKWDRLTNFTSHSVKRNGAIAVANDGCGNYLVVDPTDGTLWLFDHELRDIEACGDRLIDIDQFAEKRLAAEASRLLGAGFSDDDDGDESEDLL